MTNTTIPNPRRRRLVVTLPNETMPEPGDIVALVEWHSTMHRSLKGHYLTTQPRTNQSYEIRWNGWLGTYNDIMETAEGKWRIVSLVSHEDDPYGAPRYVASLVEVQDDES